RTPTRFSGKGSLPGNSALYGIRSKEVKGTGFGELLFDDSTGQTKTKLSSELGATQLNQGWIGHPRTDGSSDKRGEGFEARTDLAGAIRAAQGLLITADPRPNAGGQVLDRQELIGQLETALAIAKQLAELANTHEAGTTDTAPAQKLADQIKSWDADKAGGAAAIAVTAPAGVAVSSPNSVVTAAGTNLDMIAVQDANLTTGRKVQVRAGQGLSMFVPQQDAQLIAATGKIQVQAQANEMELGAAKRMHVYSLESLLLEAPQIVLRTDGAEIVIGNGKITMSSSAPVDVKAPSFNFGGSGGGNTALPNMPHSTLATDEKIAFSGRSGKGRENLPYEVRDTAGAVQDAGKSAANGATQNTITDSVIKALTVHLKP
ncbi:type VI secretion system Vgr family protein, partial [Collimonas sp.]|uniref:type VI secretion system Vgr family protein n=1 Tax=Collimonas sp. TaxID=1963772 RepID=UPI002B835CB4